MRCKNMCGADIEVEGELEKDKNGYHVGEYRIANAKN